MELVHIVFFFELIVDFQTRLEEIFKQFKLLWLPVNCGPFRLRDLGSVEIFLMLLLKLAEVLLVATCWRANKIWLSIVARVFPMGSCGWLVERAFFCFPVWVSFNAYLTNITPLWVRHPLGNVSKWVPGFLSRCTGMFSEQLRNNSELVGSEEIHQV